MALLMWQKYVRLMCKRGKDATGKRQLSILALPSGRWPEKWALHGQKRL